MEGRRIEKNESWFLFLGVIKTMYLQKKMIYFNYNQINIL